MKSKKIILVVGASSDIGIAVLRCIDELNVKIIAHCHRSEDKLRSLAGELKAEMLIVNADLSTDNGLHNLLTSVSANCEGPDMIIHMPASKFGYVRFKEQTWDALQAEMNLQVKSAMLILQNYLPYMVGKRQGRIVIMLSSVCIGVPPKALSMYTITKYALLGLMKSLASEYSDKNITINAISPSMVETSFLSDIPEMMVQLSAAGHPLKRNAQVEEVAPLVRFLLSDEAQYISGVNFPVTGGSLF
jgi:3-oxoacyl-[acyl-carrier protein] reductase